MTPSDDQPTSEVAEPLVILDGNCQAHHLAAILDAGGLAEAWVNGQDFGTVPSFRGRLARYADEASCVRMVAEARKAGRSCVQATQSTPWSDATLMRYTDDVDQVARFPYLHCNVYLRASASGAASTSLTRVYEADLALVRLCQGYARASFDFACFIAAEQAGRPLFHMHVHPGPDLMAALTRQLGQATAAFDDDAVEALAREVAAGEGINVFTQHPVREEARRELAFAWGETYEQYAAMISAWRRSDWPALVNARAENEALFSRETQFWYSLFAAGVQLENDALVQEAFEYLAMMAPGFPELWISMYGYRNRRDPAVLDRALAAYAGQRQLHNILSRAASLDGDHERAIRFGGWFLDDAADLADGFLPMTLALAAAGRVEAARACACDFAMAREGAARADVVAIMATHGVTHDLVVPPIPDAG